MTLYGPFTSELDSMTPLGPFEVSIFCDSFPCFLLFGTEPVLKDCLCTLHFINCSSQPQLTSAKLMVWQEALWLTQIVAFRHLGAARTELLLTYSPRTWLENASSGAQHLPGDFSITRRNGWGKAPWAWGKLMSGAWLRCSKATLGTCRENQSGQLGLEGCPGTPFSVSAGDMFLEGFAEIQTVYYFLISYFFRSFGYLDQAYFFNKGKVNRALIKER